MTDREKMNEYEGFTIVDEFLGVREASDGSDDELDFQVEAVSKTSRSCRHPHSRTLPTSASIDIPAAHRRVSLKPRVESTSSNGCEECEDKATGVKPDELDEISTKLNKEDGEVAFFGGVNLSMGMSSPKEDYWYARDLHPSVPLMGRARKNLRNTTLPNNLQSNSVGDAIEEANPPTKAEAGTSRTRQVMVSPLITPPTDEHPSGSAGGSCQTGAENQERRSSATKALTVRLLPGDFTFGVVVPRDGTSVSDLESEMQRELGLRDRVGLTIVEVCSIADARHSSLPDATDRCTVTARPVDRVLVRARVYRQSEAVENTPEAASTATASATPSPWDHFIQLPLRSTWSEAMNSVKSELGVPANRHAEVRRLVGSAALKSIDNDAQHGSVGDLLNGDALELRVMEVDASMDNIDGARSLAQDAKASHKKEVVAGTVGYDPIPALVWPQLLPGALGAVAGASTSTGTLPDASRRNRWSHVEHPRAGNTRRGTRSSFGGEITPAVPPPPRAVFDSVASARIAVGPPPHSRLSSASVAAPFELTPQPGAAATLALPPLSPLTSCSHFPPGAPAVRVDSSPTPPSGARPSNIGTHAWSREKQPDQLKEDPSILSADDEAAVSELVGMGFDRQHVVKALRECGRGDCWKEKAISLLLEPQMSGVEVPESTQGVGLKRHKGQASQGLVGLVCPYRCPICLSDIPAEEIFLVDCKDQHAFCVDCLYQHCSVQLLDSGVIPACPLSNTTCGHELGQEEVERVFLLRTYSTAAVGFIARDPTDQMEKDQRALETCRTLLTRRGLQSTGAVPCVSAQCGNWMVPEESGQRVRCSACLVDFCLSCKRSPYHYTADCDDVVRLTREWSWWLTEGKAAFLRTMSTQDDQHKSLLKQHEGRKKDHQRAVQEAERLRAEYDKMENWKERKCRRCPVCGRVIEKVSGCDIMLCEWIKYAQTEHQGMLRRVRRALRPISNRSCDGVLAGYRTCKDAHGGNVQNGCGARFLWSTAPTYIGDRGVRKETPFTEKEPEAAARSRYFIAPSIPLRCDRCHRDVVGPLFRCIHCPSFMCCLECQDMACRDPRHVHHIFQIMDTDTMNASLSTANASASFSAAPAAEKGRRRGAYGMEVDIEDVDVM